MTISFWSYELCHRWLAQKADNQLRTSVHVLLAGGVAGVVTWGSIYPLDVIKTVLQAQPWSKSLTGTVAGIQPTRTTVEVALHILETGGVTAFYRGFGICSIRAFIVNAVQVCDPPLQSGLCRS